MEWLLIFWIFTVFTQIQALDTDKDIFSLPPEICLRAPVPDQVSEWQEDITEAFLMVDWAYGSETCSSVNTCFGTSIEPDKSLEPQILPVQVQQGMEVRFRPSPKMDVQFRLRPYAVDESGFLSCDITGGEPITTNTAESEIVILEKFLHIGSNYFIADTTDPLFNCKFGLRINVTVKTESCSGVGESVMCGNKGRCMGDRFTNKYECRCCHGYSGQFCNDVDACASSPCMNSATCLDILGDATGTEFACTCVIGYYGHQCENRVTNLCEVNPCENNATCSGNHSNYECLCPHGYSGHHCEVNDNNCASNPCQNGVCVDGVGGHRCFCTPGFGGANCDKEFKECQSNPCRNGGYCIDLEDAFECQCGRGYAGKICEVKVNLCNPSSCYNATECIDYGSTFACTCNPGFTGYHCEVNINECHSDPCLNGGKCRDLVAGYDCICPEGMSGIHCEYEKLILPRLPPPAHHQIETGFQHIHINNLYIIAGMLSGALLIALTVVLGCYCKVHETYRICYGGGWSYRCHSNDTFQEKREASARQVAHHTTDRGPSIDALLDVTGSGYDDSAPLVRSLRPKRV